ncbi:MAG: hypothetical protein OXG81_04740 [Acidobacteria bacterium]|nr:hypothetical protein [Acidobacteriota bacterium]
MGPSGVEPAVGRRVPLAAFGGSGPQGPRTQRYGSACGCSLLEITSRRRGPDASSLTGERRGLRPGGLGASDGRVRAATDD